MEKPLRHTLTHIAVATIIIGCLVIFSIPMTSSSAQLPEESPKVYLPLISRESSTPILISPQNGEIVNSLTPYFSYNFKDKDLNVLHCIALGTLPDPTACYRVFRPNEGQKIYSFSPDENLKANTRYYWRVGIAEGGDLFKISWSDEFTFTTPSVSYYLPAPILVFPSNNTTVPHGEFDIAWNPVPGATFYQLRIYDLTRGSIFVAGTPSTSAHMIIQDGFILPSHTYSWKVTARNDLAFGIASPIWTFTTLP
jgi:hypothetical protein